VFSHGQFLNAVAWLLERKTKSLDGHAMADWRGYEIENHVQNGGEFSLLRQTGDAWTLGYRIPDTSESELFPAAGAY